MSGLVGIRGAIQASADTEEAIDGATRELLGAIVERNGLDAGSLVAAWFTQTEDLTAVYPAASARRMGWESVPMMCAREAGVDGQLPRTIRTLVLAASGAGPASVRHVYLGSAAALRPDLTGEER